MSQASAFNYPHVIVRVMNPQDVLFLQGRSSGKLTQRHDPLTSAIRQHIDAYLEAKKHAKKNVCISAMMTVTSKGGRFLVKGKPPHDASWMTSDFEHALRLVTKRFTLFAAKYKCEHTVLDMDPAPILVRPTTPTQQVTGCEVVSHKKDGKKIEHEEVMDHTE